MTEICAPFFWIKPVDNSRAVTLPGFQIQSGTRRTAIAVWQRWKRRNQVEGCGLTAALNSFQVVETLAQTIDRIAGRLILLNKVMLHARRGCGIQHGFEID